LSYRKDRFNKWIVPVVGGLSVIGFVSGLSLIFPWPSIPYWAVDFTVFYSAASAIVHGRDPYVLANLIQYAPTNTINAVLSYSYPPLLALLLTPLTALPLETASRLWLTLNLLAPGASTGMVLWATGWKPRPIVLAALIMGATLSLPCLYTYISGQASLWSLLWVSIGLLLLSRGHPTSAGASWALAWAKPHPLPLIPIDLLIKSKRGLIAFTLISLVSLGLIARWLPSWPQAAIDTFRANAGRQETLYQATALGILSYLGIAGLVIRAIAALIAIGLMIILSRLKVGWRTLAVTQLCLGLLITPYIGRSDVAITLLPILLILSDRRSSVRPAVILAITAWGIPFLCAFLRVVLNVDWLLLPLVWGGLTQWVLAAASVWYVKATIPHFDITPTSL